MTDKRFKIFLDFDGTITKNDVGEEIFKKFIDENIVKKIVDDLLADKISSRQCWESLCEFALIKDKIEFDDFILTQKIDPTLHRFVEYCEANSFQLYVLSDGFDYYIDKILNREKLSHLKVFSNKLILTDDGKLIPSFPFYNADCRSSSNCKRNHILENSSEDDYTVFIGDGNSDNDAIQYVDFIFATVLFLDAKSIVGARGHEVTPLQRVIIAIQACVLVLNLDFSYYDGWENVFVYPDEFVPGWEWEDEAGVVHRNEAPLAGEAMPGGPVVLSWPDVEAGGDWDSAGMNLVIHEFAHKIDMRNGEANGCPPLPPTMSPLAWTSELGAAYEDFHARVERREDTEIDPYAAESPAEFFAEMGKRVRSGTTALPSEREA